MSSPRKRGSRKATRDATLGEKIACIACGEPASMSANGNRTDKLEQIVKRWAAQQTQ